MGHVRLELGVGAGYAGSLVLTENVRRRPLHLSMQLAGCGEMTRPGGVALRLCLGLEIGHVAVRREKSQPRPWTVHIVGAPSLTWWFHARVGLYAGMDFGIAPVLPNFYVGPGPGDKAVAEGAAQWLMASGTLGVEFRGWLR